ncbi:Uncharacterized protein T01_3713 [Trichinella spiralis]|uniref:cyclin-dependent kinase n=1 Tax=Trichinella spiralis TaxID=6334 RepID=A0A0V1BNG5_TRISP|nr:Uncharacterized protein T01_3713 [Trichinella spiralis]
MVEQKRQCHRTVQLRCMNVFAMRLSGRFASAARNLVQKRVYATWASSARMLTLNNNFAKASIVSKSQPPPMRLFCSENNGGSCSFKVQDYEDFKDRVIGAEKPVVVQFYADWCGPCQLLSPRLETAVCGQQGKLTLAKVDVDDCADLALEYGVASIPTVMAFRRGSVVDQFSGVIEDELIDTRTHIVKELLETETSYVENLKLLVHKYLRPLKRPELCSLVELGTLNEIFFQVPEMLGHHELFLAALKSRLDFWDCKQKIGDVVLNNFTKQSVIDTYTAFINNWKNARVAIRKACIAKPAFAKYLERCSREHQNKLNLDALLIMPVQRIPRYELLIKELVKHTSVEHPDHALLLRAGKEIHELASKIDQIQQETGFSDQMQQKLREIEAIVEGLDDLVSPERTFYRCDQVYVETPSGKKDRCLFLFSDLLLITTVTSKSGSNLSKSSQQTSPGLSRNFFEKHKFRLLLKLSLQDLSIVDNKKLLIMKVREDIANLQEDLRVVGKLAELTLLLKIDHKGISKEIENLSDFIKVTLGTKHEELAKDPNLASLNLMVTTEFGNEPLLMTFRNTEKRLTWERNFEDAKYAFALSQSQRQPPAFVKFIAANRTRAGLHFTCASPAWPRNSVGTSDVWMCSSDQCSGQLCVLSASTDFEVININSLCNSRISCICCIPGNGGPRNAIVVGAKSRKLPSRGILTNNNHLTMPTNIDLDSDTTDNESSTEESRISEVDRVDDKLSRSTFARVYVLLFLNMILIGPFYLHADYMLSTVSQKIPHLDAENCEFLFTTWIGTENGIIQIYDRNESMRTGKCKSEMQLQSSIRCMLYHENKIFVALGDGSVGLYDCDDENQKSMKFLELEEKFAPISAMVIAVNKLWCGSRNHILVINLSTFKIECLFAVNNDRESTIECLASSALAVWLSMYNSAVVKLYHAHKRECLIEINVAPTVTKTLAGCDDIIRQHKLACLRVTSLLCCKEMLWVGTSAGVLCYLPIPQVTHQTLKITTIPGISGTNIGHMGPCRFLVSLEVPEYIMDEFVAGKRAKRNDLSRRRMSLNVASLQQKNVYVISGGEGLEDFQDSPNDENDDTFVYCNVFWFLLLDGFKGCRLRRRIIKEGKRCVDSRSKTSQRAFQNDGYFWLSVGLAIVICWCFSLIDASCLIFSFACYTSIRATMGKNGVVTSPWTSGGDGSRYSELGTIGSGAYGMVIKVKNVDTGEMVAVKKIVVPITSDGVPQSVIREVGLLKRIGEFPPHKNIVQMLQVMHGLLSPSELFINVAFEYCLCDLNTFLHSEKGKNLNMDDIRTYCLDILKGIQFLQQMSIIHRDIKPQNILLGKDGHLKLTDFGLARIYAHANLSPLVVTLWYRAPEILLVTTYTTAADIWSFACILAEMLKKTPLFPGDSEIDQLKKIFKVIGLPAFSEWPADAILPRNNFIRLGNTPLSTLFRDFEPDVIDLLKSVLTFNPDDRLNLWFRVSRDQWLFPYSSEFR